ncbi:MAG: hypothetical protein HN348_13205 [Proteobacteria bacterium]|nr:hypothetical protein [Pseudomonadota bacterium]
MLSLLVLFGCPYVFSPPDLDDIASDDDGDGYDESTGDCDDSNNEVYPGAAELCDGVLNDCDLGSIPTIEVDDDGDGYVECEIDARGWAGTAIIGGMDCDDTDDLIGLSTFPGAAINNGQGCMKDVDDDEYGDESPERPNVDAGTDCDDEYDTVNPGLEDEALDGLDNDCSGEIDRIYLQNSSAKFTGEGKNDSAGHALSGGDFDGDGSTDVVISAISAGGGAGAVYVVYGSTSGLSSIDLGSADTKLSGGPSDYAGWSTSTAGDFNDDGYDDLLVGAALFDEDWSGATYLLFGSPNKISSMNLDQAQAVFEGESQYDDVGRGVSGAGDFNGDGYDDIVVGAVGVNVAYLILGSAEALTEGLAEADAKFIGNNVSIGDPVADLGDINGDGYSDLALASPFQTVGSNMCGAVYVMLGTDNTSDRDIADADARIAGEDTSDQAGRSVAGADINGDGYADALIGAPGGPLGQSGGAYWLFGSTAGMSNMKLTKADGNATRENVGDYAGWSIAGGDVNGDGFDDVLVGAPSDTAMGYGAGAAYVILGSSLVAANMGLADAEAKMFGEMSNDSVGWAVTGGDTNGDGYDDVLLGANGESSVKSSAGAAYLILGGGF